MMCIVLNVSHKVIINLMILDQAYLLSVQLTRILLTTHMHTHTHTHIVTG